jgi:hypothetical protein
LNVRDKTNRMEKMTHWGASELVPTFYQILGCSNSGGFNARRVTHWVVGEGCEKCTQNLRRETWNQVFTSHKYLRVDGRITVFTRVICAPAYFAHHNFEAMILDLFLLRVFIMFSLIIGYRIDNRIYSAIIMIIINVIIDKSRSFSKLK